MRRKRLPRLMPLLKPEVNLTFNAHFLDVALRSGERVVECPITFHPRIGLSKGGKALAYIISQVDSNLYGAFPVKWLFGVLLRVLCSEVCPGKASMFSRRQSCRGNSQSPVVWIAEEMETEPSKPIDKVFRGEITSHRAV